MQNRLKVKNRVKMKMAALKELLSDFIPGNVLKGLMKVDATQHLHSFINDFLQGACPTGKVTGFGALEKDFEESVTHNRKYVRVLFDNGYEAYFQEKDLAKAT